MNKKNEELMVYIEVDRAAKRGDRIRIVNAELACGKYKNGDEFVVRMPPTSDDFVRIKEVATSSCGYNAGGLITRDEYVVLEPIDSTPLYKAVCRDAAHGEKIRIIDDSRSYGKYSIGDVFDVEVLPFHEGIVRVEDVKTAHEGDNPLGEIPREAYVVLEPVEDDPSPKTERDLIASLAQAVTKLEKRVDTMGREILETDALVDAMLHVQSEQIDIVTDVREDVRGLNSPIHFDNILTADGVGTKVEDVEDIVGEDAVEDVVASPNHYNFGRFETIEIIEDITSSYTDGYVAYAVGNVIKYIARSQHKHDDGGLEDLLKAAQYLKFAIESITGVDDEEAD